MKPNDCSLKNRKEIFFNEFKAMYTIHKGSFDAKQGELFRAIVDQYYYYANELETDDIKQFMWRFKTGFPKPEQWINELKAYKIENSPKPKEVEEVEEPEDPKWKALRAELAPILMDARNYYRAGELKEKCRAVYKKYGIEMPGEILKP